jgi:short-subunit dehydrogenase
MNPNLSTQAPVNPRTVLITGASSGIGAAFADVFAAKGFQLVITARREDRLRDLAASLRQRHGTRVDVIVEDLSQPDAPARLCETLVQRGLAVDVLVNNAGYGVPGAYLASEWARHAASLQVMVIGLAELTHRLLPGMTERGYGRIINVASLAALVPAPAGHTLYAASKAFVVKFSEALASEVRASGVHVTAVCPGFTLSEFHDVTGTRATVSQLPGWLWMDAPSVARQGFDAVMAGTPVSVTGRVNRLIALLARYLPQSVLVAIGRRTAGRYRKS